MLPEEEKGNEGATAADTAATTITPPAEALKPDTEGGKKEPEKTVPYERFFEVNEERKAVVQQLDGMKQELANLTQQVEELTAAQETEPSEEPQFSTPEEAEEYQRISPFLEPLQEKIVELNERILQTEEKNIIAQEQARLEREMASLQVKYPSLHQKEVWIQYLAEDGKVSLASLAEKSHKGKLAEKQALIDEYVKTKTKDSTHISKMSTAGVPSAKDTEAPSEAKKTFKGHFDWAAKKATEFLKNAKSQ